MESNTISNNKDFSVSLAAFWVKGTIFVDEQFLRVKIPNTILFGLIPAGLQKDSSPLQAISNVYTSSSFKLGRMALGALVFLAGIASLGNLGLGAVLLALIGFLIFGSGILTTFSYERSGIEKKINLPFFEANHARELAEQIEKAMSTFQESRNITKNTDRILNQMQSSGQTKDSI
ncbi:DUF2892 domain-containing protein [Sporolactobacillus sp. CPB3-1]|uniref:DUF2892 domain-containing protein n=1 Tax=Sporolactobacillus mangiferae TaxID=2940498 RepID=A0ABT0MD88_9BACL|nr:DUF2892 domain-containing protein [Sporolactobacillus mangiferae]MCL1632841.1 DUF2892 domain-containing protein [Sporolactobacillus mangiferae]